MIRFAARVIDRCALTLLISFSSATYCANSISISSVDYPPLVYQDAIDGLGHGIGCDIVNAAFRSVSLDTSYDLIPMARNVWSLIERKSQANLGNILWFEKQGQGNEIEAVDILNLHFVFFYKKSSYPEGVTYKDLSELKEFDIGNVRGSASEAVLDAYQLKISPAKDIRSNIRKLNADRIDLAVSLDLTGWMIINEFFPQKADTFAVVNKSISQSTLSLIFLKENNELKKKFEQGMSNIIGNGEYQHILKKYYKNHAPLDKLIPQSIKNSLAR